GAPTLAAALLRADAVDRIAWFTAPIIIGGTEAPGAVADPGATRLADAPRLDGHTIESVGDDVLTLGRLRPVAAGA
ncbi:MAG: dihydrofolate reductase family protein, partial [Miltoncostaeaceae bacterium]